MSTATATFSCPSCDATGELADVQYIGEVIACASCTEELEVQSLDPVQVALAPEPEEDWGE